MGVRCVDQSMIFDHFRLSFFVILVYRSEYVFRSGLRRYRSAIIETFQKMWAAIMDAFQKVWARYNGCFLEDVGPL